MIGWLTEKEIDDLLFKQAVGRIACCSDGFIYLVPLSYGYDGQFIYIRSFEGKKLDIMRKNPNICFEVDDISDMANWQSVLLWGKFEELKDMDRQNAINVLLERHLPMRSNITTHLGPTWPFSDPQEINGTLFRIVVEKRSGKFEKP